jgi:hypothetical protein
MRVCINSHNTANLNFLFLSLCVYLFNKCPSEFLSHWELVEPVSSCEELCCLSNKNQNKSLTLSSLEGKFTFALMVRIYSYTKIFFHRATFTKSGKTISEAPRLLNR